MLNFFKSFFKLEIYTDGSSKDGIGSWAYVITKRGKLVSEQSGRVRGANSNTMEFQAAIEVLAAIKEKSTVTLFSDSRILVDAMKFEEAPRGHEDQFEVLKSLKLKHQINWQWIKAHSGHQFNERCDELCAMARAK